MVAGGLIQRRTKGKARRRGEEISAAPASECTAAGILVAGGPNARRNREAI